MYKFESMALHPDEIVDSRFLHFEAEYHRLDLFQMRELAQRVLLKIGELFGESFYLEWRDSKRRTSFEKILNSVYDSPKPQAVVWMFSGIAVSPVVYNHKTYIQYEKWLEQQLLFNIVPTGDPVDYLDICDESLSNIHSNDQLKQALLDLYNRDGLAKKSYWRHHDIDGLMHSSFYWDNPGQYYGHLHFRLAKASMSSEDCITLANELAAFLQEIGTDIPNVSGRIALSPIEQSGDTCCGHMVYFGYENPPVKVDPPPHIHDHEWRTYYYLKGVEWCNLISSLQAERLHLLSTNAAESERIVLKSLPNGAFIVQSPNDIIHTDVSDLMPLKLLLYDVLYPGSRQFDKKLFENPRLTNGLIGPRSLWLMVPMLSEEIEVTDEQVIFRHKNALE